MKNKFRIEDCEISYATIEELEEDVKRVMNSEIDKDLLEILKALANK